MDKEKDFKEFLNPASLEKCQNAFLEPSLKDASPDNRYQFERQGYFCLDAKESVPDKPVFNRIVTLRDTWAKMVKSK